MLTENIEIGFCIDRYKHLEELPFDVLNNLPYSVYVIDDNWVYLFVNSTSRNVFGEVDNLLGTVHSRFFELREELQRKKDNMS